MQLQILLKAERFVNLSPYVFAVFLVLGQLPFDFAFLALDFSFLPWVLSSVMRTLLVLLFVALAAATNNQQPPGPPEFEGFCSIYSGFPMFAPLPPTYPNEEFLYLWDEGWYPFFIQGGIPAPIEVLQNLVCDMSNTMLWKAEDEWSIFWLGPSMARTHFTDLSPYIQLMDTTCMFDQTTGLYAQYINDEFTNYPIAIDRFLFQGFPDFTYVSMEYDLPVYTLEYIAEYYDLETIDDAAYIVYENMQIELGRLYTLATADNDECEPPAPPPF